MESLMQNLSSGHINVLTTIVWLLIAGCIGALAGGVSAIKLGGKDLGTEVSLMMGIPFGVIAVLPGILVGLIVLKFI